MCNYLSNCLRTIWRLEPLLAYRQCNTLKCLLGSRQTELHRTFNHCFVQMQTVIPQPSTVTHLDGLVPEGRVGKIVPVDLIRCGVYVDGSHYLE